ncbi:rhomboid family intramembrane serine protease [Halococcus dombrowskii]|uniref:Rhomboid family intramembrane serine protease n=1 Tax=Halococcus dombrowskii TaxID=179637 RepID=A0AAV3SF61_HALDO|nr:rhomboid family intramembrane serine protease [Halococcus dombrowskii]UOO94932.1 rhomboid family intramembrane serine protease [Halococcus dombrowskii]
MSSPWLALTRIAVALAVVLSALVALRLDDRDRTTALRARFLAGIPWGTLLTMLGVLAVYLFVQGGFQHWYGPLVLPFRAWSYGSPLGIALSSFAHVGPGHLIGNLIGTLALAPLAEYAWGHYPDEQGPKSSLVRKPLARVLAIPAAALLVGLFVALFAIGPVIGFSGVLFAIAGVALIHYPLATVVALAASDAVRQVYAAVRNPVVQASADPSFGAPWWAGIAIQAHAIGLLVGVLAGIVLVRRRETGPTAGRLWLGTVLFAISQSLWAVYWFRGNGGFVLYRALGVVLVFGLALLVVAGVVATGRVPSAVPLVGGTERWAGTAVVVLLALAALSAPAIPVNLTTVESSTARAATTPNAAPANATAGQSEAIAVRDYTVRYAENITNRQVSVVDVAAFGESTTVNASGVIVTSERRHLWTTAVQASRLAFTGRATVRLGGLGWDERIRVSRSGWQAGDDRAYKIWLNRSNQTRVGYRSAPATADATIRGKNVSIVPRTRGFGIVVSRANETLGRAPLPNNGTTRAANLTFSREGRTLFAATGATRVPIAERERYR